MSGAAGLHSSITIREIPSDAPMGGPSDWELEIVIPMGGSPWIGGDHITVQGAVREPMTFEISEVRFSSMEGTMARGRRVR